MIEEEEETKEEGEMKNIESDVHARPGGLCAAFLLLCEQLQRPTFIRCLL